MNRASDNFIFANKTEWTDLGGGVSRKILGWDNQVMMVKVKFEQGAVGAPHTHFHTQTTYCAKGKFEFTIGDEKQIISYGDGVYIPPNAVHGAVCLEEGVLIDVFSPVREDFLDGDAISYFGNKND
jgi:quercetin dioxygenase-like cupin family protein